MSVNSYLTNLSSKLIIRDSEKESIKKSYDTLCSRLKNYFGNEITFVKKFGSYQRNTILPRKNDDNSDIDVMVLFDDSSYKPRTYLRKLRDFAKYYYFRSEIYPSHPTVVLELNHIKFELVPAVESSFWSSYNYQIPAKSTDYEDWLESSPFEFAEIVTNKNSQHSSLIKPLIRIMKLWNIKEGRPFTSYQLEQMVVHLGFYSCLLSDGNLQSYFYSFVNSLIPYSYDTNKQNQAIQRLRSKVESAKQCECIGRPFSAEVIIKSLFE